MSYRTCVTLLLAAAPLSAQRPLDLTGTPAAALEQPFTKIAGVVELSDGSALITDNMDRTVSLANFAKKSIRKVGAQGRGPNEYQYPSVPIRTRDGAAIVDPVQRRVLFVGATGAITGMKTLPDESALSRVRGADAAGKFYFEGPEFDMNTRGFNDSLPVVTWDPATNKVQTLLKVWGGGRVVAKDRSASYAREVTPFPTLDAWQVFSDGSLALLRHEPYRIDRFVNGKLMLGESIPFTPIPIGAAERAWHRQITTPARSAAVGLNGTSGPQMPGRQFTDEFYPAAMPPFIGADVLVSPDDQLWIPRPFTQKDKVRRYDIHDAKGKLIGSATLTPHAKVVGFGPKSVYVARTNPDDDLVYLQRFVR